ncbi:alpha/beta fold hydrolase [Sphingomonas sp. JC676]|uniref:alpha/beta fold hydrolase n=1 Tax=Sphingomonas sp. JC676 TaxID=2768065 RepID=UPI001CA6A2EF|nr:alpha/beta hydrolase [Sphingomonas sp. JC676]
MNIKASSLLTLAVAQALNATPVAAQSAEKPAIVLVHGAFADAASWAPVISILQQDGYQVTAVEEPLESFAGDVATTERALDAQTGPVVLVGHSYGGAVITEAAAGKPNVKALVYLAAIVPDAGEPIAAFLGKYPTDLAQAQKVDSAGFVTVDPSKFRQVFAADLSAAQAAVAAATQKPIKGDNFGASPEHAAWKAIPSWYVVSSRDHALSPDLERFYAKRIGALTTELDASHVAFISHAKEVAALIEEAASAK